jgi:hypothetical protein
MDEMAIALRLAAAWLPATPHGEIVKRRVNRAIAAYECKTPTVFVCDRPKNRFANRLMR